MLRDHGLEGGAGQAQELRIPQCHHGRGDAAPRTGAPSRRRSRAGAAGRSGRRSRGDRVSRRRPRRKPGCRARRRHRPARTGSGRPAPPSRPCGHGPPRPPPRPARPGTGSRVRSSALRCGRVRTCFPKGPHPAAPDPASRHLHHSVLPVATVPDASETDRPSRRHGGPVQPGQRHGTGRRRCRWLVGSRS